MPRHPTIYHSPLKKAFVCSWCNGNFRSKAGHTRHINAKHNGLPVQANSPQSAEGSNSSEVSSCPGSPSPLPSIALNTPSCDSFNLDENNFNFSDAGDSDIPQTPLSESPSRDTPGPALEYHPYLDGKMDNI